LLYLANIVLDDSLFFVGSISVLRDNYYFWQTRCTCRKKSSPVAIRGILISNASWRTIVFFGPKNARKPSPSWKSTWPHLPFLFCPTLILLNITSLTLTLTHSSLCHHTPAATSTTPRNRHRATHCPATSITPTAWHHNLHYSNCATPQPPLL